MNIVVCLKQVPGTTDVKIDPETNTLRRQGIETVVNPFDAYALEEAVSLRERFDGKVTAISMGPPQAEEMLREAISCGADEAVLVSDRAFAGADTLATSYTLSRSIQRLGDWDLVICGRQTIDGDTGQVGPGLAEWLDVPFVAYVSKVEAIADGLVTVRRMVEDGHEVIEMSLPGVITVTKEINVPRLPSLRGKMKSKRAEIPAWTATDIEVDETLIGLSGSPTTVVKVFYPQRVHDAEMIEGDPEAQASSLVDKLREVGIG